MPNASVNQDIHSYNNNFAAFTGSYIAGMPTASCIFADTSYNNMTTAYNSGIELRNTNDVSNPVFSVDAVGNMTVNRIGGSKWLMQTPSDSFRLVGATNGANILLHPNNADVQIDGTHVVINGQLQPSTDNAYSFGTASLRWSQIYAANATISTSDKNAKTDIVDLDGTLGLALINKLRPVSFKYKIRENKVTETTIPATYDESGKLLTDASTKETVTALPGIRTHLGLIAQEVKAAIGDEDIAVFTKDQETGLCGLRYEELIASLIKAIQELNLEIENIKTRVLIP